MAAFTSGGLQSNRSPRASTGCRKKIWPKARRPVRDRMGRKGAFYLKIVSGPEVGKRFPISETRVSVGRQPDNDIVLASTKVSKHHCVLLIDQGRFILHDRESANGTFLNGIKTQEKEIVVGDQIAVGEYVFELKKAKSENQLLPIRSQPSSNSVQEFNPDLRIESPKDLKDKVQWFFEKKAMPIFYKLLFKYEWKFVLAGLFGVFLFINLLVSVYPATQMGKTTLLREAGKRAQLMAKLIVDRNANFLASGQETRTELGFIGNDESVRLAMIVDLDHRIIAPSERLNQYLTGGTEAGVVVKAKNLFRRGREIGFIHYSTDGMMIAVEPIKVFNPSQSNHSIIAMAVVSVDTSIAIPQTGELGVLYSQTLILTALLALFVFFVLYRLTLKPFEVLNEDIDRVLKGDQPSITHEFKFSELNSLFDIIRSTLQRVPTVSGAHQNSSELIQESSNYYQSEEFIQLLRFLSSRSATGVLYCDESKKILYMNSVFESLTGIRQEASVGQNLLSVVRDQAQSALFSELLEKVGSGNETTQDEFEFSAGLIYPVQLLAVGQTLKPPMGYLLVIESKNMEAAA